MRERTQSTVTAMEVAIYPRIKKIAGGCLRCLKDVYQSKQSPALHFGRPERAQQLVKITTSLLVVSANWAVVYLLTK